MILLIAIFFLIILVEMNFQSIKLFKYLRLNIKTTTIKEILQVIVWTTYLYHKYERYTNDTINTIITNDNALGDDKYDQGF